MALDRAIQLAHAAGEVSPTLRLYSWLRPTVTLGRFQSVEDVDRGVCTDQGIDVVRRYTGGRGVLHDDEVTYSIVAGVADGMPRGTAASYRMLCSGLVEAYRLLGVDAALTARPRGNGSSAACYLHSTAADLSLGAMKLSGSAQVWSGETLLQHGSFTLSRDVGREARVFRLAPNDRARLAEETATLESSLGSRPSHERILDAIERGLARGLGIRFAREDITEAEIALAASLLPEVSSDRLPTRVRVRASR